MRLLLMLVGAVSIPIALPVLTAGGVRTPARLVQPSAQVQAPSASPAPQACSLFGVTLTAGARWSYAVNGPHGTFAFEDIHVAQLAAGKATLSTEITFGEETAAWSSVIDCATGTIVRQDAPDLAYSMWPFPGVFVGQRLDVNESAAFTSLLPAGRRAEPARQATVFYTVTPQRSSAGYRVERQSSLGQFTTFDVRPGTGPAEIHFADGSYAVLVSAAEAATLKESLQGAEGAGLAPEGAAAETTVTGSNDYSNLCGSQLDLTTYNGHWPQIDFQTLYGTAADNTALSGDDFTALHDDRDSEFLLTPTADFASQWLASGQSTMEIEWESVMLFPRHPAFSDNYPDPAPADGTNQFVGLRDISYQSPRAGDQVAVHGAVIVDCGHSPFQVEAHPPLAMAWSHSFAPGIADYFVRASAYGWYPHVENFGTSFDADLEIPDADSADPGSTPFLGAINVDYTLSGYDVADDVHSIDGPYAASHPAAHLVGGDLSQPVSTYFDLTVTVSANQVHIHAAPKAPWNQETDNPQRPAVIGLHFMACVPVHDAFGVDLNGCVGGGGIEPPYEYVGQVLPVAAGGQLTGWFKERHRPTQATSVEVRAYSRFCDPSPYTESLLGTVLAPAVQQFTFQMPSPILLCATQSGGPVEGIVIRPAPSTERPQQLPADQIFNYMLSGLCMSSVDTVTVSGECPPGTGFTDGFHSCTGSTLIAYCEPGVSSPQPVMPVAPVGVTAAGGSNQVSLSWQAESGTIFYRVYSVSGSVVTLLGETKTTAFTVSGLANFATSSYSVSAANSIGEGPRSAVVTATTAHCSATCTTGCCSGETCAPSASLANGCVTGGAACGAACGAGFDVCRNGACGCHQVLAEACGSRSCGTVTNACGGTYNCGTCTAPDTCSGGASASCVCVPIAQATACAGVSDCNTSAPNGCGGFYTCNQCPSGQTCGKCDVGVCFNSNGTCR